jgi:hypothetical protein
MGAKQRVSEFALDTIRQRVASALRFRCKGAGAILSQEFQLLHLACDARECDRGWARESARRLGIGLPQTGSYQVSDADRGLQVATATTIPSQSSGPGRPNRQGGVHRGPDHSYRPPSLRPWLPPPLPAPFGVHGARRVHGGPLRHREHGEITETHLFLCVLRVLCDSVARREHASACVASQPQVRACHPGARVFIDLLALPRCATQRKAREWRVTDTTDRARSESSVRVTRNP